jgi:hypothetical protein
VPDLAVEVLSPSERPRHVLDKVGEYLEAGVRLVWVIDPRKAKAVVYRSLSDVTSSRPATISTARRAARIPLQARTSSDPSAKRLHLIDAAKTCCPDSRRSARSGLSDDRLVEDPRRA